MISPENGKILVIYEGRLLLVDCILSKNGSQISLGEGKTGVLNAGIHPCHPTNFVHELYWLWKIAGIHWMGHLVCLIFKSLSFCACSMMGIFMGLDCHHTL